MKDSTEFFLKDYAGTLFPLRTNRLLVEKYSRQLRIFTQENVLTGDGGFQTQHRVFASKSGWFVRRTLKLDPVAEFFLYDLVYRNRRCFGKFKHPRREVYGFRIEKGEPLSSVSEYGRFKNSVASHRLTHNASIYFDVASYFNHIYHHDLVRFFEDAGISGDDVCFFGKFLREIVAGRSVDCLPQGIYPAKMIGSAFLSFIEESNRVRANHTVRLMDDVWLFDNDRETLVSDFLLIQSLLSDRGLSLNEHKSAVFSLIKPEEELFSDLDEMKIHLLQMRRAELIEEGDYGWDDEDEDEDEDDPDALDSLSEEEQEYLVSLLKGRTVPEEDAELVLTLMSENSTDVMEFLPLMIEEFPALSKRIYQFCGEMDDKEEVTSVLLQHLGRKTQVTEYQLFWFGMMAEDYLLKTRKVGDLLAALYEHDRATAITRAKVLEIPERRFGLPDLREEQLRTGHSDWQAWSAAIGARVHPKGQRNQMLKYFRKSSQMNRLIGEFVEQCF